VCGAPTRRASSPPLLSFDSAQEPGGELKKRIKKAQSLWALGFK